MAARTPLLDYYEILGVPRDAAPADIEAAFRSEMLRVRDLPGSGEQTRRIGLAYRALSNPERRRDYDAALSGAPPPAPGEPFAEERQAEEPSVQDPPPPLATDNHPDDDRPRRGRGLLLGMGAGILLLLLLAGLWAGGLFGPNPRVAGNERQDSAPAEEAATGTGEPEAADEGGGLADALASLLPSSPEEQEVADAQPAQESVPGAGPDAPVAPAADSPTAPANASDGGTGGNAAAPAPEPVRQASPPPADPPRAEPPPPPPRAVDRSSGPRLVSGGLVDADNAGGRFQGSVSVRLRIGPSGRAQGCSVTRSSGNAALDSTTCRLLQERLQFIPARDRDGNPVATEVESTHVWGRQRRR